MQSCSHAVIPSALISSLHHSITPSPHYNLPVPIEFSSNFLYNVSMTDEERKPGPYNYCDYRCDKCEFKDECTVYAKELEAESEGKETFEVLKESLAEAHEMLNQMMEEQNIDIYEADVEDEMKALKAIRQKVEKKPVIQLAHEYLTKADDFLNDYKEKYLTPLSLSEAFSDLDWYKTIIPVKMQRTLTSFLQFALLDKKYPEFSLEDAYHTSEVVYKALRKSLSAVRELKEALIDYTDIFTELENLLIEITNEFRHEFPFMILMSLIQFIESTGDNFQPPVEK
ncbi:MAG: hypothetical protein JSV88_06875 [Candidatus Aminicenantes bacterium]|nr:MAG: hypothetical protein JSV88_06875 [Candidatus Aminicenantes bacterium]